VRVTRLPLNTIGDVEYQAGILALEYAWHEVLETIDELFVAFQSYGLVASLLQRVDDAPDGLKPDLLLVGQPKKVNDVSAVTIVYNSYFQRDIPPHSIIYEVTLSCGSV
jgi:hypothetical protein